MTTSNSLANLMRNEKISYLFWGVLTTLVYFVVRFVSNGLFNLPLLSAAIAELVSILFAFVTNRQFVFTNQKNNSLTFQLTTFFLGRLAVALMDLLVTYIVIDQYAAFFIRLLKLNAINYGNTFIKIPVIHFLIGTPTKLNAFICIMLIQVLAIVINYLLSKYLSFK